jgi:hypothetical protein
VIDRGGFDEARPSRRCEQKQGGAVRSPGYGNAEAVVGRSQPVEVGAEAVDQLWFRLKFSHLSPSLRAKRSNPDPR